jgi:hypothetical protein
MPRLAPALRCWCGLEPVGFRLLWRRSQGVGQHQVQDVIAEGSGDHVVRLEIDRSGQFLASSAPGSGSDEARLQRDRLVIPTPEHDETLELVLVAVCCGAPEP